MRNRIVWGDIKRNKTVSLTIVLFAAMASLLLSLAGILTANLVGSIDLLMQKAKTPHFMQMHSGEFDMDLLSRFAKEHKNVAQFQVLKFLNMDSSQIILGENSLSDNLQDNGFCTQSKYFDYLLDLENNLIHPKKGELYVPVCYFKDGTVKLGDNAFINGKWFTVAGFVRDSQMNSSLASSKRFLVSEEDYEQLEPEGNTEYLIEFRLKDLKKLNEFEKSYNSLELPINGPVITWPLFKMINAISDGIMIGIILLVSMLATFIALLCIRFSLLAKIEEDDREISVMKAIGLRAADINTIYLSYYGAVAGIGTVSGFLLSFLFRGPLTRNIQLNFGSGSKYSAFLFGMMGALILFLFILLNIHIMLRRLRKISAAEMLRFGMGGESVKKTVLLKLSDNRLVPANLFLGIKDVWGRKRLYSTMLIVLILACFIIMVPQNVYYTISNRNFVTYMGVGICDLRMDIQQTGQIDEKTEEIKEYVANDEEVGNFAVFTTKIVQVKLDNGGIENMKIELGDHASFPLQYAQGTFPFRDNEIALSSLNATELNKTVGDKLTVMVDNGERQLTICGIYSDITNGGKTAKAVFNADSLETVWSVICVSFKEKKQVSNKLSEYTNRFHDARVSGIQEYVQQNFGPMVDSVKTAALTSILAAVAVIFLVTLLFMKLLSVKDRYSIAVMKTMGFTNFDIKCQYGWRAGFVVVLGVLAGILLAGTLGEKLASMVIASFGADTFRFTANPFFTYMVCPFIMLSAALAATIAGTSKAGNVKLAVSVKE